MTWLEAFGKEQEPAWEAMDAFVENPIWQALNDYIQQAYAVQPKKSFSGCSGQPGWNVKYQKAGKSLCTLYPMRGYFIALVVIGEAQRQAFEMLAPTFTPYIQALYESAGALSGARWLMIEVRDAAVLADVKRLITLRRSPKVPSL